jgi:hypothetical protein
VRRDSCAQRRDSRVRKCREPLVLVISSVAAVAQWIEYWPPKPRVVGSIPASRTKPRQNLRKPLFRMVLQAHQALSIPRLDTTADTLTEKHGQFFRDLSSGFSMTKWPGYSLDRGCVRFRRRIPADVHHAFNGAEWIRIPLNYPSVRQAQRSALAWYVIYEEEFAQI